MGFMDNSPLETRLDTMKHLADEIHYALKLSFPKLRREDLSLILTVMAALDSALEAKTALKN